MEFKELMSCLTLTFLNTYVCISELLNSELQPAVICGYHFISQVIKIQHEENNNEFAKVVESYVHSFLHISNLVG